MKILILGAGPAGLTLGNRLKEKGINSFLILEKEEESGGLCRSVEFEGEPIDIGGPHYLDHRSERVMSYLFGFMPESEWNLYERDSKILVNGQLINSPFEANLWQMDMDSQVSYLESISVAGCNTGSDMPEEFKEWIYWKLGRRIADDYMIPYNSKLYGDNLDSMGTYWLYKLPNVSFRETLLSCLQKHAYGTQPCVAQFYYPKNTGFGELWRRMAERLENHIICNQAVNYIDLGKKEVRTKTGDVYRADIIITTIPWRTFDTILGMPDEMKEQLRTLKYVAIENRYVNDDVDTKAQWVYFPDMKLPYHRATIRKNVWPSMHGMIIEINQNRAKLIPDNAPYNYKFANEYAYPVNTIHKPEIMNAVLDYSQKRGVYGLGRWGEHQHHNSDVVVELAMDFVDKLVENIL